MSPYSKNNWSNGIAPALSAANLGVMETGIEDAHLGDTYATANVRYFIPENYAGCDPTGMTSSKTAFSNFFGSIPDGGLGIIPAGSYILDGSILDYSLNKSITLDFTGAVVTGTGSSSGFSFNGSFGTTYTVSAITTALSNAGEWGNNGENMYYTQITTNAATGWKKGDLVKLVSDDIDNEHDPSANARSSESMYVLESSGTTVYLRGEPRCPYNTANNIRVAKWSSARLRIIGGMFQCSDAMLDGSTINPVGVLRLQWLAAARLEGIHVKQAAGPGITLSKCYGVRVLDYNIDLSYDGSDTQQNIFYGYGINDDSEYTIVDRMLARRVRHAYTSSGSGITTAGSNLRDYGRTFGSLVMNSICWGATQSSFDTHEGAEHVEFLNCISYEGYGAFGLRGSRNRITNCKIIGRHHAGAITMWDYSGSRCNENVISGLYVNGCKASSIINCTGLTGAGDVNYVVDAVILNRDTSNYVLRSEDGTLKFSNVRVGDTNTATYKQLGTNGVISAMSLVT